ncbi:gluconate 2-dehydrogenase subunit 3 family protein [Adhaeribacter radiodurans]|uniref:Gluconate 2-dehydrogenase subunit 3 family protein n=1 Tax=Adhaeribacter radiodurans TaxID=2745197 RepID=A0A7L7LBX8_9BACT|nr:gluconate 2-dehydrogenase subunit 3 family protein [Adhaeribacter radiodurans]QMU29889.1 gluconate 2-dehydrogenase subunit 3 family protein [Adhaeribacter radiodurans]
MNRREAISAVAYLMGSAVIGAEVFLTGCQRSASDETLSFSENTVALLDEVAETILPGTNSSPGAKAAHIGTFIKTMVIDCYEEKDQKIFAAGLNKLQDASKAGYDKTFMDLSAAEKHALLVNLDKEAKSYQKSKKEDEPSHYFTMLKQLTLLGYFTSEPGATKALNYLPVPGRFEGCIPYEKGTKAWAM